MAPSSAKPTPSSPSLRGRVAAPQGRGVVFIHPTEEPTFVPFPPGRLILGRDPAAGIPLAGRAVSWQHAEVWWSGSDTFIRDLGSTNGVVIAGQRVTEARLDGGALLRIGDFLGVVSDGPPVAHARAFAEAEDVGLFIGPVLAEAMAPLVRLRGRGPGARVVIEGETGTGKSLIARLVHQRLRAQTRFTPLDAALLEVESTRLFEAGKAGTAYLTNLTALSPTAQGRLARELGDKSADKLGVVVGSQEPFGSAVASGRLDAALASVLAGVTVHVPPLRVRGLEIPRLFRKLLAPSARKTPSLSTELVERLCLYDWPLNVREMSLLAQRLSALHGDEPRLRVTHLPPRMQPPDRDDTTLPVSPVTGVDLRELLNAVRDAGGNIGGAALRLGITRERAYRLIDRLGIVRGSA